MIRLTLLSLFVISLLVVALRFWYVALCGLLFLTVFTQHPSMPTNMLGIQGLNPWNAVFLVVLVSWLLQRNQDPPRHPTSPKALALLTAFTLMTVISGFIAAADYESIQGPSAGKLDAPTLIVNTIINPLKYVLVGVMFFDGARSAQRLRLAIFSAVGSSLTYALLLFKSMGLRVFTIDFEDARRMTDKLVGLFANDLAELFAFTIWAGIMTTFLCAKKWHRLSWLLLVLAVIPPFLALKSRAGFVAVCTVGVVLGFVRWRRILILLPVTALVIALAVPTVTDRILMGVATDNEENSWDEISAGRVTNIWPATLEQIAESPIIGHGQYAILRNNCYEEILANERYVPSHPHCSYLEILLDCGIVGLAIVLACAFGLARVGLLLTRMSGDPLATTIGAAALAALVAELTAGITGSSFFPSQSSVPYLCVWGTALRACVDRCNQSTTRRANSVVRSPFDSTFFVCSLGK
ncbi:MAG: O-antigen ligase family protein [Planctomycetota bacterium]